MQEVILSPSDFVAVLNQTLEFAYPGVSIVGELANFRVSKNKWVYFDLKDEFASVKFFGTVYQLPGPLEDGLLVQVRGIPRLHPQYGFSVTIQSIQPVGEGSLRRAAALLESKLSEEGLFNASRKRSMPFPPQAVGLVTSAESAAYADFVKVLSKRWGGVEICLADVLVQGDQASGQVARAIEYFNGQADQVDAIVIIRGGGSAEDLAAFNTEQIVRAIAASRIPTLVAIGHETDLSLAELAADLRASTPSNAAELLVPEKRHTIELLSGQSTQATGFIEQLISAEQSRYQNIAQQMRELLENTLIRSDSLLKERYNLLQALNPQTILQRGYAVVHIGGQLLRSTKQAKTGDSLDIQLTDGNVAAKVQ